MYAIERTEKYTPFSYTYVYRGEEYTNIMSAVEGRGAKSKNAPEEEFSYSKINTVKITCNVTFQSDSFVTTN